MKPVFIYALADPDSGQIRYVGKTTDVRRRFLSHCRVDNSDTYKSRWLAKLFREGKLPVLLNLETVEDSQWQESERKWIAYYRALGSHLVNSTSGGDGGHNPPPDVRAKIGAAARGRVFSDSHKSKIRQALAGRSFSSETISKMGVSQKGNRNCIGRKLSEETRRKISLSHVAKKASEEVRRKMAAASTGRNHSEESKSKIREIKRLWWIQKKSTAKPNC